MMGQPLVVMMMPSSGLNPSWTDPALKYARSFTMTVTVALSEPVMSANSRATPERFAAIGTILRERGIERAVRALLKIQARPVRRRFTLVPHERQRLPVELDDEFLLRPLLTLNS